MKRSFCPVGIKKTKSFSASDKTSVSISILANALKEKPEFKKNVLRLKCISMLPDSEAKQNYR